MGKEWGKKNSGYILPIAKWGLPSGKISQGQLLKLGMLLKLGAGGCTHTFQLIASFYFTYLWHYFEYLKLNNSGKNFKIQFAIRIMSPNHRAIQSRQWRLWCSRPIKRTWAKILSEGEQRNTLIRHPNQAPCFKAVEKYYFKGQQNIYWSLSFYWQRDLVSSSAKSSGNLDEYQNIISSPIIKHLTHISSQD